MIGLLIMCITCALSGVLIHGVLEHLRNKETRLKEFEKMDGR